MKENISLEIKSQTKIFAEAIVFVALSAALNSIKLYQLPYGGSVTLAGMVPILWLSLRRGPVIGTYAGVVLGLVVMIIEPYLYNPVQILLDYPIAFGALGLAGIFKKQPLIGVGAGMLGRFISHFISGVFFFYMYAEYWNMDPITYSVAYNGSYLLPEFIVSAVIIYIISKKGILNFKL
ncbi:MAG: energy-coupled thiamine transporter ThiT [Candidatus Bathyarchaeia archaeon]